MLGDVLHLWTDGEDLLAKKLQSGAFEDGVFTVAGMQRQKRLELFAKTFIGLLITFLLWQFTALALNASGAALGFPLPVEALQRLVEYLFTNKSLYGHSIYEHILASIKRLLCAFGLASVFGILVGSVLGYFSRIYHIGMVPVAIFQMVPGLAWLPVAILIFGLGDAASVFIIFMVTAMVITIGVSSGIKMVPPVYVNAGKMMGAGPFTIFFKILIPHAAMSIVNALRLGMSSAWRVLISAEMVVGTGVGIGYSIELTRDLLDYVGAFACILVICLIGLFFDRVVLAGIERYMRGRLGFDE
ncbi:MAG: ABC transporter permease [Coriobacteriia bacterium]|nr:ABC transporter permease [Coriobacteriia bacterium]